MMKRYIAFERDFLMNRVQLILDLDLLLQLLKVANPCYQMIACIVERRLQIFSIT